MGTEILNKRKVIMTTEEAKKAGFRTSESGWATTWRILTTNEIHRLHSKVRGLDSKDFPTRAKAREALRKCKIEAATKREEARVAARKAAGTQVTPPKPSETPAERDARIKALVDGYIAKGGPITREQLTDEIRKSAHVAYWTTSNQDKHYTPYKNSSVVALMITPNYPSVEAIAKGTAFWNKADAEHARRLADMQSQMEPITPAQAKMLRAGDVVWIKVPRGEAEEITLTGDPDQCSFDSGAYYWTREAAQAAHGKDKCSTLPEGVAPVPEGYEFVDPNKIEIVMVDSKTYIFDVEEKRWHLLNGFNSGLMVSTKWNLEHGIYFARPKAEAEPQDKEPVKYAERKRGEIVQAGDEVLYAGCDWHSASHELGAQAMGVLGDYSCPTATRYLTPEWKAWAARQDIKESNKEPVAPVEVIPTNASESAKLSNKPDAVSHPSHYTSHPSGVECITITKHMNFCRGNAVKYLWRAGQKGDSLEKEIEDIAKAEEYCRIEKERLIATKGAK